jgi:steroid delta-isomerase
MEPAQALARYVARWHALSPALLGSLDEVFTPDARFADPFSDVRGHAGLERVFRNMFERCLDIRLRVSESAVVGDVGLMHWQMRFKTARDPGGPDWVITGMSRVVFAADGRVAEHVDHWDAASQVYLHLPVVGALMRWLRHRIG